MSEGNSFGGLTSACSRLSRLSRRLLEHPLCQPTPVAEAHVGQNYLHDDVLLTEGGAKNE